jgi:hypothetical protein
MKKTRDLITYGYKSFTIGTIKSNLLSKFEDTSDCIYKSVLIKNGSGLKFGTECYLKCEKDEDCQIAVFFNEESFSRQRCFPLVSQKDESKVAICREDSKLYEWYERSNKFVEFGFFPLVNKIDLEIENGPNIELTESYQRDCKKENFVILKEVDNNFSQGFFYLKLFQMIIKILRGKESILTF